MESFRDIPIRRKLTLSMLLTSAVGLLLAAAVFVGYEWFSTRAAMERDLQTLAEVIGANSVAALSFSDPASATETLSALKAKPTIEAACIYDLTLDSAGALFASYSASASQTCPGRPGTEMVTFKANSMELFAPIELDGERIGVLFLRQELSELRQTLLLQLGIVLAVLMGSFFLTYLLSAVLQRIISRPILDLATSAVKISESGDYSVRANKHGNDEVGQLIDGFNKMLEQIEERDIELAKARDEMQLRVEETNRANAELGKTLDQLQNAQEQLVQTEKMASLGGLVAGVAHEINTPVGVGVTAASTLKAKTEDIQSLYADGKMKRSDLDKYMSAADQSSDIILNNLHRAAELIQSFKQVAVDQSSSERRRFNMHEYLDEVLLSLRPKIKKTPHRVELECPNDLMVNSYPGALSQIVTNLVMNSLIHAFDDDMEGVVSITITSNGNRAQILFKDNGKGMDPETMRKIFDPFFTTKRGSGGSGLGMHIVYNLVTQTLGGNISVTSAAGEGTTFNMTMPIEAEKAA